MTTITAVVQAQPAAELVSLDRTNNTTEHPPAAALPALTQSATPAHSTRAVAARPVPCLRRARLLAPGARGKGVWVAFAPGARNTVYVEGPYRSHRVAQSLARSVTGKLAVAGGPYVVIAALGIHLDGRVAAVASCLRRARPGKGGSYSF